MEHACANIALVTLKLKRQYKAILGASPGYGVDKRMTKEVDALGLLIKELEDEVVLLQIKLDQTGGDDTLGSSAATPG
jgi:hypothetical protein